METPVDTTSEVRAPLRGVAVASVALGFFSMCVFWWFPFGFLLACFGFVIGLGCTIVGLKGGMKGENLALLGMGLCAVTIIIDMTLFNGIAFLIWDH